jgi:capsular polysaccharide biosynthesis protein
MDLFRRLIHAANRDDSWKSILREKIYNFIFKNSKIDVTEIQYLQEGNFRTRVVEQTSVASGTIVEFYDSMNKFRHIEH